MALFASDEVEECPVCGKDACAQHRAACAYCGRQVCTADWQAAVAALRDLRAARGDRRPAGSGDRRRKSR